MYLRITTLSWPRAKSAVAILILAPLMGLLPSWSASAEGGSDKWFNIEPRVWLTQVNTIDDVDLNRSTYFVPMYGGSISITPPPLPGWSLLVTGLYGTGEADALFTGFVAGTGAVSVPGTSELTRTDVEGLIRFRIPNVNAYVFTGPRYVRFDELATSPLAPGQRIQSDNRLIIIEFGAGAFAGLDDAERHRVFGNLTTGAAFLDSRFFNTATGFVESTDDVNAMVDVNLGYQWLINDWLNFNFRYRSFLLFINDELGFSDTVLMHGPEIGLGIRF